MASTGPRRDSGAAGARAAQPATQYTAWGSVQELEGGWGEDTIVADRQANEVLLTSDVLGAIKKTVLVGQSEGLLGPIAVESSEDNQRVFIADSGSNSIYSLELAGGTVTHFSSRRPLAGLFRLRGKSIFRVTELTGQPILLFDGGAELRAFFVPVEQAKFASGGESVLPVRGQSRPIRVPRRRN